jgi:hypothetical protein
MMMIIIIHYLFHSFKNLCLLCFMCNNIADNWSHIVMIHFNMLNNSYEVNVQILQICLFLQRCFREINIIFLLIFVGGGCRGR